MWHPLPRVRGKVRVGGRERLDKPRSDEDHRVGRW